MDNWKKNSSHELIADPDFYTVHIANTEQSTEHESLISNRDGARH